MELSCDECCTGVSDFRGNPPPSRASASGGHTPGQTVVDKLNQFAAAARSLLHRADTVSTLSTPVIADYTGADGNPRGGATSVRRAAGPQPGASRLWSADRQRPRFSGPHRSTVRSFAQWS